MLSELFSKIQEQIFQNDVFGGAFWLAILGSIVDCQDKYTKEIIKSRLRYELLNGLTDFIMDWN